MMSLGQPWDVVLFVFQLGGPGTASAIMCHVAQGVGEEVLVPSGALNHGGQRAARAPRVQSRYREAGPQF